MLPQCLRQAVGTGGRLVALTFQPLSCVMIWSNEASWSAGTIEAASAWSEATLLFAGAATAAGAAVAALGAGAAGAAGAGPVGRGALRRGGCGGAGQREVLAGVDRVRAVVQDGLVQVVQLLPAALDVVRGGDLGQPVAADHGVAGRCGLRRGGLGGRGGVCGLRRGLDGGDGDRGRLAGVVAVVQRLGAGATSSARDRPAPTPATTVAAMARWTVVRLGRLKPFADIMKLGSSPTPTR